MNNMPTAELINSNLHRISIKIIAIFSKIDVENLLEETVGFRYSKRRNYGQSRIDGLKTKSLNRWEYLVAFHQMVYYWGIFFKSLTEYF